MKFYNKSKGVISIVALIIFSLLMLFALIINSIVYDTYQIIKNTNNFFNARDVTSSVFEYLKTEIEGKNAGFNLGPITCSYEAGVADEANNEKCSDLKGDQLAGAKDLYLEFYIEARHDGDAQTYTIPKANWNKLFFGNSLIDNLEIPLYHEDADTTVEDIELNIQVPDNQELKSDDKQLLDIVLFGKCENKDCSYKLQELISATYIEENTKIFNQDSDFLDLHSYDGDYDKESLESILDTIEEPVLKIRLINQLIEEDGSLIDYLEYQLTTNDPISYPSYQIYIKATVEDNTFIRKEEVDYQRNILDSAIN